jgi:uncharacterized protein involved in exopolysaccharide biosynthesis
MSIEANNDPALARSAARHDEEIDLRSLLRLMWRGRLWIAIFVVTFAALAATHAFLSERIYRASTLVAVRSDDLSGTLGVLRGQLGGLASLAGIGSGASGGRRQEFIGYLKSRALARAFVEKQQLTRLFYASLWDPQTQNGPSGRAPTVADATDLFISRRQVDEQPRTGLLVVAFEWRDPLIAAQWANEYVELANEQLRGDAIAESKQSIAYLTAELERTTIEPVRHSLYSIMESRLNQAMVASVEPEYAFKPIDRAEAPDPRKFVRPKRAIEIFLGIVFGGVLGVLFVFWRYSLGGTGTR